MGSSQSDNPLAVHTTIWPAGNTNIQGTEMLMKLCTILFADGTNVKMQQIDLVGLCVVLRLCDAQPWKMLFSFAMCADLPQEMSS